MCAYVRTCMCCMYVEYGDITRISTFHYVVVIRSERSQSCYKKESEDSKNRFTSLKFVSVGSAKIRFILSSCTKTMIDCIPQIY